MLSLGIIDRIVPEPIGAAHKNPQQCIETLKSMLTEELKKLNKIKPDKLVEQRVKKFCNMGAWKEWVQPVR